VSEWETKVKNLKDELMQLEGQRKGRQGLFVFVAASIFIFLSLKGTWKRTEFSEVFA
jgi:hypothetical protein